MTTKTTYTVSAPAKSGYSREFEAREDARSRCAELLGIDVIDEMVEVDSPDGGTVYCYADQDDADADQDGAYAVQYTVASING